jgi:periplasmic protein TonB
MRKGVIISLVAHGVAILAVFVSVTFNQVTYFPRETYRVRLVSAAVAEPAAQTAPPAAEPAAKPEPPKPEPVKEEPKEKELTQPIEKPKPQAKPSENKNKVVPRAQATKSDTTSARGDTLAGPASGAASGAISFDGGDFPYDAFIARMRQKIAAAWQVPAGSAGMERFAVVYFRVHRDGNITHIAVEQPSGAFLFDQSCQRAVLQAAPFPPLPREYVNEYVGVHFSFKYEPTQTP